MDKGELDYLLGDPLGDPSENCSDICRRSVQRSVGDPFGDQLGSVRRSVGLSNPSAQELSCAIKSCLPRMSVAR